MVGPSVRTRQIVILVNLGMLALNLDFKTFRDYVFRKLNCKKLSYSIINTIYTFWHF